jgi:hypothetical protein
MNMPFLRLSIEPVAYTKAIYVHNNSNGQKYQIVLPRQASNGKKIARAAPRCIFSSHGNGGFLEAPRMMDVWKRG